MKELFTLKNPVETKEGSYTKNLPKAPTVLPSIESFYSLLKPFGLASVLMITSSEAMPVDSYTSPENTTIIESVIGVNMVERLEKLGFKITIPVKADKTGSYIIHFGQSHLTSFAEYLPHTETQGTLDATKVTRSSQDALYKILLEMSKLSGGIVFNEGVMMDHSKHKENLIQTKRALESFLETPIETLTKAKEISELIAWYGRNIDHPLVNNFIPRQLAIRLEDKMLSSFPSITLLAKSQSEKQVLKLIRADLVSFIKNHSNLKDSNLVPFDNAVDRLYMEEVIDVAPSETREANDNAMEAVRIFLDASRALIKLELVRGIEKAKESPEALTVKKAKEDVQRIAYTEREEVALKKIAAYNFRANAHFVPNNTGTQHVILVYGNDHKFSAELIEHNNSNDASVPDRGLIEIKTRLD